MNSGTGHLVREDLFVQMKAAGVADGYEPLPPELWRAAEKKLGKASEATVSRRSGGQLSRHAARKRRSRREMEKATRRKNR